MVFTKSIGVTILAAIFLTAACGTQNHSATTKSVEIPQTPVKSQGRVGFCWSYATVGFLEGLLLKKNAQSIDLSEEAIGFYRMAQELEYLSRQYKPEELADAAAVEAKTFEGLEGWDLTFNNAYNPGFKSRNSLQLVQKFGVVPEYAWSYKFLTDEQRDKFFAAVFSGFASLVKEKGQNNVTQEMVFDLLASPEAYGSRPPSDFNYVYPNGKSIRITSVDFAANVIGFTPDDFTYMYADGRIGYNEIARGIKLALSEGYDVPLSYVIYENAQSDWDASYVASRLDENNLKVDGGHAVLITDFVNKGGRPGAISPNELKAELAKSSDELDFVVFKNSWDTTRQSPLLKLPGYFTMDQAYLKIISKKPGDISVVVPRDVAMRARYNQ